MDISKSTFTDFARRVKKGALVAREPAFRAALRKGVAPSIELEGVPLPAELKSVFDVGANRGQFMLWATQRFKSAKVWCFEPLPDARETLKSVVPAGRTVEVVPVGLGAEPGTATFFVAEADDSSSLLEASENQLELSPASAAAEKIEIIVSTLDEVIDSPIERPSLLKIDVQGTEVDVLKGASKSLESIDFVLAECSFVELYKGQAMAAEVIDFMSSAGFSLRGIYSPTSDKSGVVVQADLLFVR